MNRSLLAFRPARYLSALVAVATACGGDIALLPPTFNNVVDTTLLYALRGTPLPTPSGFDVVTGLVARPELGEQFDFVFDLGPGNVALITPSQALGFPVESGLQIVKKAFDAIDEAPLDDYVLDSSVTVTVNDVFVARSRVTPDFCSLFIGALPRYGKFHVLAIDTVARTITLENLVNSNCGYRSLLPGTPER